MPYYYKKKGAKKTRKTQKKNPAPKSKPSLVKLIKNVTLKQSETKYVSKSISVINFYHDTFKGINLWDASNTQIFPAQGTSDGHRNGDEIYLTGIMIRAVFVVPFDRRNMRLRMWFVPHNPVQGDPTVQANFQHNITGNIFLDPIQTDRYKGVKYLGTYRCLSSDQTTTAGSDKTILFKRWLPINRKITFQQDNSQAVVSGLKERGYIICTQYDTTTTLTTDVLITSMEMAATLYFKDP